MDSEGIWNACTIHVTTKMAITTVHRSDCKVAAVSDPIVCARAFILLRTFLMNCCRRGQMFQYLPGSFLFGALLGRSFGSPHECHLRWRSLVGQSRFYGE